MKVEFNWNVCNGWFQCIQEWEAFEMNVQEAKASLEGGTEVEEGVFTRDIPASHKEEAKAAAETCPVDAIKVFDDNGNQIVP